MSDYLNILKLSSRWDNIPSESNSYKLLCNQPECSLSCANLKRGTLSITSVHGTERHSYLLTKKDMVFLTSVFLSNLKVEQLEVFLKVFNKVSDRYILNLEEI